MKRFFIFISTECEFSDLKKAIEAKLLENNLSVDIFFAYVKSPKDEENGGLLLECNEENCCASGLRAILNKHNVYELGLPKSFGYCIDRCKTEPIAQCDEKLQFFVFKEPSGIPCFQK